jgi:hypothetical protein
MTGGLNSLLALPANALIGKIRLIFVVRRNWLGCPLSPKHRMQQSAQASTLNEVSEANRDRGRRHLQMAHGVVGI